MTQPPRLVFERRGSTGTLLVPTRVRAGGQESLLNNLGATVRKPAKRKPQAPRMQRAKLQHLEEWDDARYSIVPPRAARDRRIKEPHFRILILLGRVNTQRSWCICGQKDIADGIGMARSTVNPRLDELVQWGYVEKRTKQQTRSPYCHYRIRIDAPAKGDGGCPDRLDNPSGLSKQIGQPPEKGCPDRLDNIVQPDWTTPITKNARALDQRSITDDVGVRSEVKAGLQSEGADAPIDLPTPNARLISARAILASVGPARSPQPQPSPPSRRASFTIRKSDPTWETWIRYLEDIGRDDVACEARAEGYLHTQSECPPSGEGTVA